MSESTQYEVEDAKKKMKKEDDKKKDKKDKGEKMEEKDAKGKPQKANGKEPKASKYAKTNQPVVGFGKKGK